MSHLLARIMLALLMLPLAAVVYTFMIVLLIDRSRRQDMLAFLLTDVAVAALVAIYWVLLWRTTVRWTANRIQLTLLAAAGCTVGGAIIGAIGGAVEDTFGAFIGGIFTIITWLAVTVLIWRERPHERFDRIQRAGVRVLPCPRCGYNLTGLRQATCPECGASFTLDELMAEHMEQEELKE